MQVDEAFKEYLRTQPFTVVCLKMDLGAGDETVVLVKAGRDGVEGLRAADAPARLGWLVENTDTGPVLCMLFDCKAAGVGDLVGESWFDVAEPEDRSLLQRLASQERLNLAFVGEELEVIWFRQLPWSELRRLEVEQALDRAEELLERADNHDFEAAKEELSQHMSLDQLLGRVFPDDPG